MFSAYDEVLQAWCFAEDLDSFEHAGKEAAQWLAGSVSRNLISDSRDGF